jgi:hypothetical protein
MTYRRIVDLSFVNEADALEFDKYLDGIKGQLYVPKLKDIIDRPDLYTADRMYSRSQVINDFDDEKQNKGGISLETKTLVSEIKE